MTQEEAAEAAYDNTLKAKVVNPVSIMPEEDSSALQGAVSSISGTSTGV